MKMSNPCLNRLFVKSIIHLNLLLIWQLGSNLKCESAQLPDDEVAALSAVPVIFNPSCNSTEKGYSITCDECPRYQNETICHVTKLRLFGNELEDSIPSDLGNLDRLKTLELSNNKFNGGIPDSLGNLQNLERLDLSNNKLNGAIPDSLGNLRKLKYLYLYNNFLEGVIPPSLGDLASLQVLYLDSNMLSGPIPDSLGNLDNLTVLSMAENKLSGTLPPKLGNLTRLQYFSLASNDLKGRLPDSYANLADMRQFYVDGNDLLGPLPHFVTKWPYVLALGFQGNNFEGEIHKEYFNLSKLRLLWISDLNTSSQFRLPRSAKILDMYSLVLRNCSIIGSIPSYISELSGLNYLDLSFNILTGAVPDSWKSSLTYMSFANNNLTGSIPSSIFGTDTRMDLSYNNFSNIEAPVPHNLNINLFACCRCQSSSCPNIKPFMLEPDKMMETYFPSPKKRKFHSLFINSGGEETIIHRDRYEADSNTSRSYYVSPKRNWAYSFSGWDFSGETFNFSDHTRRLPCKIPDFNKSIYADARLSPVSLRYYGLGLRKGHYQVTLHFAEIVYTEDVAAYNLQRKRAFDVYIQNQSVMADFDIREQAQGPSEPINKTFNHTVVNDGILHIHFYWTGRGSYASNGPLISAISVRPEFRVGGLSVKQKAFISVASILFAPVLLLFAWRMGWLENKELKEKVIVGKEQTITLKELIKATGNFSKKNKIGNGSLGTVYKAEPKDGKFKVAVRRLSSKFKDRIKELETQTYNMKTVEDDNLIKLWDVHIGALERLIIYEFMEDKSLEDALFGPNKLELHWDTRTSICRGIAKGLKHLHESPRSIVHGNIKPTNILLHGKGGVKLSDFGLVSVYGENEFFHLAAKEASKCLHPVEYFNGNISTKSDVYSFGIILLVIVSGRRTEGVRTSTEETEFLLGTAYELKNKGRLNELVDKRLNDNYTEKEALTILNLALVCTHPGPVERPTISEALAVLEGTIPLSKIVQRDTSSGRDDCSLHRDLEQKVDPSTSYGC